MDNIDKGNSVNGFVFHLSENGAVINTLDIENIPKTVEIVNANILIGGVILEVIFLITQPLLSIK